MTVAEKQQELISDLQIIEDVQERLSAVVSRAARKGLSEEEKTEERLVKGCVSRVWLKAEVQDGRCVFQSDADSPMVKGLVALLCEVYDGGLPEEVLATTGMKRRTREANICRSPWAWSAGWSAPL